MISNDQVACGTTTTGAGTLTLAPPPTAITAADPFAAFGGSGFGTTVGVPIPYSWVEYTDATYTKPKQAESGIGTLLFGANLAASTLARTTVRETATSMDSQPATVTGQNGVPTALTIGTAANVVVWFGTLSWVSRQAFNFYSTSTGLSGSDNLGVCPTQNCIVGGSNLAMVSGRVEYQRVELATSLLVKSMSVYAQTAFTGTSATLDGAIYEIGSDGKPGKRLLNFIQNTTIPLNANTLTATNPLLLLAGTYYIALLYVGVGQSTAPALRLANSCAASPLGGGGTTTMGPQARATVATQTVLNDPATLTSLTLQITNNEIFLMFKSN